MTDCIKLYTKRSGLYTKKIGVYSKLCITPRDPVAFAFQDDVGFAFQDGQDYYFQIKL